MHTKGDSTITYHLETRRAEVVEAAAGKLRKYNTGVIDSATFDKHARELRKELMPDMAREIPIDPLGLSRETVADWVVPHFIRADILALRYHAPLPAAQLGYLRPGGPGRGGRRRASEFLRPSWTGWPPSRSPSW